MWREREACVCVCVRERERERERNNSERRKEIAKIQTERDESWDQQEKREN